MHYAIDHNSEQPEGTIVRYSLDPKPSTFTVRAFSTGLLSAFAHNPTFAIRNYEAEAQFDPERIESTSLKLTIHAASLAVVDNVSDKDRQEIESRMRAEVLETDQYPEIVYQCSNATVSKTDGGQYWMAFNGELSLHGVMRPLVISARVALNGTTVRAFGDFSVLQSEYGIKLASAAGGTIRIKDELKLSFNLVCRKQE